MTRKKEGFTNQREIVLPKSIKNILVKNELTKLLYITDIGYYPNAKDHYIVRKNGVDQNILIYCTEGEGWVNVNGEINNITKGDFFIIEANLPHLYAASEKNPWSIYWVHFTGEKSQLFKSFYNIKKTISNSNDSRVENRIQLFEEIYQVLERGYSTDNLEYTSLCLWKVLASFLFISQFRVINNITEGNIIQESINYMKTNINKKLTLKDIASSVNYSPSYFGQIFLKKSGHTPLNYFHQLKIQKACQLLDFSDLKIKEIAYKLGFYDQYHFSKTFYKIVGISPSLYKKRIKG